MSGIYIHVPFCKSRCIYCDFYSTVLSGDRNLYVDRLLEEARERTSFCPSDEPVKTVYIGGGTPSQLPATELCRLVDGLVRIFDLSHVTEFTLEANPEDITAGYASALPSQINRVSMGVQTFVDNELRILNRRHDSRKPAEAVALLREKAGIHNISIDLMYGLPEQTLSSFEYSIGKALELDVQHISAYNLSVEEGTRLDQLICDGKLTVADDELCLAMASTLREKLGAAGFIQYEISNYARPGFESRHNSSYWTGVPYLGLGPGAHSYDGRCLRSWNEPDLRSYLDGQRKSDSENLTPTDIDNERIMLGLRTRQGFDRTKLQVIQLDETVLDKLKKRGLIATTSYDNDDENGKTNGKTNGNYISLTKKGLALADEVIRELMVISLNP